MTLFSRLLKTVVAAVWVLSTTLVLALPTPKEIETAVSAGHYTQAETLLREVLQDKPRSAKAHYELGQVLAHEQRYKEAQTELQKAKDIDPSLKFAASAEKFNAVFLKVSNLAMPSSSVVMEPSVAPGTHAAVQGDTNAAAAGNGFSMSYVWLGILGLVVVALWLRRSAAATRNNASYAAMGMPAGAPPAPRGFGAQFTPNAAPGGYPPPQGYAQPNNGGSTMTGAVVGGLAGVAAGYALSKAFEGHHPAAAPSASSLDGNGYVPFDAPAQADLGTFDAGAGDAWDSAADGGDNDSW